MSTPFKISNISVYNVGGNDPQIDPATSICTAEFTLLKSRLVEPGFFPMIASTTFWCDGNVYPITLGVTDNWNTSTTTSLYLSEQDPIEQVSYRWRNDDGTPTTATWAFLQDVPHSSPTTNGLYRLRVGLKNTKATARYCHPIFLEYREKGSGDVWLPINYEAGKISYQTWSSSLKLEIDVSATDYITSRVDYRVWPNNISSIGYNVNGDGDNGATDSKHFEAISYDGFSTVAVTEEYASSAGNSDAGYESNCIPYEFYNFATDVWEIGHKASWVNFPSSYTIEDGFFTSDITTSGNTDLTDKYYTHTGSAPQNNTFLNLETRMMYVSYSTCDYKTIGGNNWVFDTITGGSGSSRINYHGGDNASVMQHSDITLGAGESCTCQLIDISIPTANLGTKATITANDYIFSSSTIAPVYINQYVDDVNEVEANYLIRSSSHPNYYYINAFFDSDGYPSYPMGTNLGIYPYSYDYAEAPNDVSAGSENSHPNLQTRMWIASTNRVRPITNSGMLVGSTAATLPYNAGDYTGQFDYNEGLYQTVTCRSYAPNNNGTIWVVESGPAAGFCDTTHDTLPVSQNITTGTYNTTMSTFNLIPSDRPIKHKMQAGEVAELEFLIKYKGDPSKQYEIRVARLGTYSSIAEIGDYPMEANWDVTVTSSFSGTKLAGIEFNETVTDTFNMIDTDPVGDQINVISELFDLNLSDTDVIAYQESKNFLLYMKMFLKTNIVGYESLEDLIMLHHTIFGEFILYIVDQMKLELGTSLSGIASIPLTERLRIASFSTESYLLSIVENLNVTKDLSEYIRALETLIDSATLASILTNAGVLKTEVAEVVEFNDAINRTFFELLTENLSQHLANIATIEARVRITEDVTSSSYLMPKLKVMALTQDYIGVSVDPKSNGTFTKQITEEFLFVPGIQIGDEEYEGFVLNPENTAVSTYGEVNYKSSTKFNDVYLYANSEGLFRLADSYTTDFSKITTASMDLGTDNLKQIPQVYLGMNSSGDTILTVRTDGATEATYNLKSDQNTTKIVKIGKGLIGQYWQFSLLHDKDIDLDTFELYPIILGRKI